MSQSSGFLGEEELRVSLNDFLNTNLDRDALMRPTREMLIDIYSKFLDSTNYKWRFDDSPIEAYIISYMNKLMKPQDPPFKFLMTDIIAPNRKRTNYFLNYIVYVKAHYSEYQKIEQSYLQGRAENEASAENLKAVIQNKRQILEDLAVKRGALPPKEQLVEKIEAGRKKLMELENLGEELKEKGKTIKDKAKVARERLLVSRKTNELLIEQKKCLVNAKQEAIETSDLEDQLERQKQDDGQILRDKNRSNHQEFESIQLDYQARLKELQEDLNSIPDLFLYESELSKEKELRGKQLQELEKEIRSIEENDAEEKAYQVKLTNAANTYISRLREDSSKMDAEILAKLSFLKPKLEETLDAPADRTYIKK